MKMIDEHNAYSKKFRQVRDYAEANPDVKFCLRLMRHNYSNSRTDNLPSCDEVAALIIGDESLIEKGRDIIVKHRSGDFERLHETHDAFIPLQYPLIFPYGERGYQEDMKIKQRQGHERSESRQRVTLREFIAFRIQERDVEFGNIVKARRLFQQFVVDCYTMVESQRLSYIRANQSVIRCDHLHGLQDAVSRGELDPSAIGRRVILPSSFTGSTRYMFNNCQDAMAICKYFGYPDLFITITCNPKWPEIHDFIADPQLKPYDRPDIVSRVFKMKVDNLLSDLKKNQFFGKVDAG